MHNGFTEQETCFLKNLPRNNAFVKQCKMSLEKYIILYNGTKVFMAAMQITT